MVEKITFTQYSGLESAPLAVRKRIIAGEFDEEIVDIRGPFQINGYELPARTREIKLFDRPVEATGKHEIYAAIKSGHSVINIVYARGETPESARWQLGFNYNIDPLRDAYQEHSPYGEGRKTSTSTDGE
jgi:hypothetical protein